MRILFTLFIVLLGHGSFYAQSIPQSHIREDLRFLKESIITYNPALDIYNPDFRNESEQLINNSPARANLMDYFEMVSRLCALSNEGHFAMGSWSDTVHKGITENTYAYLPLYVVALNNQLYVWKDLSDESSLADGDEILSINGRETSQVLANLHQAIPADGNISTYKEYQLSISFPFAYYFFGEQAATFTIVSTHENTEKTQTLKALTRDKQIINYEKRYGPTAKKAPSIDDFYELHLQDNYALLKLKSFSYQYIEGYKIKSKKLYKEVFKKIAAAGVQNLIVDLRGNTGGRNEFADDILPYIIKEGHKTPFLKKTVSWKGKEKKYKVPGVKKNAFLGKIYVLVNGATYSSGATLARYLKEYGRAMVLGEEAGTRYEGFAAGSKQYVNLPHSGLRIGIPRYHIFFPASQLQTTQNRGLLPDHEVKKSINDLINNTDPVMDYVFSLLKP